jgi:hypothetical protein
VSGAPREPWKWASKRQFRTVDTVSEKVVVLGSMASGICAAIGVGLLASARSYHQAHEHRVGLVVFGIGMAGFLLTLIVGAAGSARTRREP